MDDQRKTWAAAYPERFRKTIGAAIKAGEGWAKGRTVAKRLLASRPI